MIDPKELRIGNLVLEPECEPYYFEVEAITSSGIYYRSNSIHTTDPEPIPLSEEWLKIFGFNSDLSIQLSTPDMTLDLIKCKEANEIYFYPQLHKQAELSCDDNQCIGLNRIQFVHQLQNMYFCLTGKELQINH